MEDNRIYKSIIKSEPITKGFSGDKKYCVTTSDGTKYLLRIIPMEKYETSLGTILGKNRYAEWQNLFKFLERLVSLGIPTCKPVELGTCPDGIYVIQSWIQGENLNDALPELPETKQYQMI
jgi:aminoglycoside phosphotransferase (APT) family kinase protein